MVRIQLQRLLGSSVEVIGFGSDLSVGVMDDVNPKP